MKHLVILIILLIPALSLANDSDWMQLLQTNQTERANELCHSLEQSSDLVDKASAYKCYANLSLMGKDIIIVEGNDLGGGQIRGGWRGEPLDKALYFLSKAIEATPKDETIHQGRMHLLLESGLYPRAFKAFDESLKYINGKEHLELWLAYTPYYFNTGHYKYGIEFTNRLIESFGQDHRLYANLGGMYAMLKEDDKAILNLETSLRLNPNSPVNTWNLARVYDYNNKLSKADDLYKRALSLKAGEYDTDLDPSMICHYAEFLYKKLNDVERACEYNKEICSNNTFDCE